MYGKAVAVTYPNMVSSLTVNKVNGTVNTYTVNLIYQIAAGDDPNLMEKVLGTIKDKRRMYISYGDWNQPTFIYKEEEVLVTKVNTRFDFANSRIYYDISAVSTTTTLTSSLWNFGRRVAKPSTVILELLQNQMYGLQQIFTGMTNIDKIISDGLIPTSDKVVNIPQKHDINVLDYLAYLVGCMTSNSNDADSIIHNSVYKVAVYDDITNQYSGTYFKIIEIPTEYIEYGNNDIFEVDVGYPTETFVTKFDITTNDSWAILYESAEQNANQYSYLLNTNGGRLSSGAPNIVQSVSTKEITEANKNWWTQMTKFPIQASLEIQGLLRPAMLMQYVKINSYFYGQKFIASGIYIITKQVDTVNGSGFKTTLTLTRVGGDTYEDSQNYKNYQHESNKTSRVTEYDKIQGSTVHTSSSGNVHGGGGRHF